MPIDAKAPYDEANIFAKILKGEIPNKTVLETEHSLAFHDITPQAPVHILVIPKGPYVNFDHFGAEGDGYRLIANSGAHSNQEVPHMHFHILGGRPLGRLLPPAA